MSVYLDKLRSTLNEVQTKQISAILLKKKKTGEIRTLEEFKEQLGLLTAKLLSSTLTPSLQVFLADFGHVITSDTFNNMLEHIKDDLDAVFSEENTIEEVLDSHINIVNNVMLKSIRYGIGELESKIDLLEFLNQDKNGFLGAQFNTFNTTQDLTFSRSNKDSNVFFLDPRTRTPIINDASIEVIGDRLTLGHTNTKYIEVKHIEQIFDEETRQSAELVSFPTNDISSINDNTLGTYWLYSVLQDTFIPNGITTKIKLELSNTSDINFIEISAASPYPMQLLRIDYRDSGHGLASVVNVGGNTIQHTEKIYFDTITTNEIHIVVQQLNPLILQYENKNISQNFINAVVDNDTPVDTLSAEREIRNTITSSRLLHDVLALDDTQSLGSTKKYYDYTIGFDNIRLGTNEYASKSIFVSTPLEVSSLNQLGLKHKASRPFINDSLEVVLWETQEDISSLDTGLGSIEYWAILQNLTAMDELVSIKTVPLLPQGIERVYHESLVLSERVDSYPINNASYLMFYTLNDDTTLSTDMGIYKNGVLLVYNTDWSLVTSLTNNVVPPNGLPNRVAIKIHNPDINSFYTVSYNPLLTNTRGTALDVFTNPSASLGDPSILSYIVDLVGDSSAVLGQDNIVYLNQDKHITKTKVYLAIILRRTTPNKLLSPLVDEYLLLTSHTDMDKFNV